MLRLPPNARVLLAFRAFAAVLLAACGGSTTASSPAGAADAGPLVDSSTATTDAGTDSAPASACALTAATTATTTISASGCALLDRDTTACAASRTAAGLTGFWLDFSCRVTLTVVDASTVRAAADGQPDYTSNYFPLTDPCYAAYSGAVKNPNAIVAQAYALDFPRAPGTASEAMRGGAVGLAINGVPIFDNAAAPGDDIFSEAKTFDRCAGHPQQSGAYHYHSEPYALSSDDARFIGVMRDGYPLYGRKDADGTTPTLDTSGGHTGVTAHSPTTPAYHYHVNAQTSSDARSAGETQWFLTTGTYRGAPGACTGCQ